MKEADCRSHDGIEERYHSVPADGAIRSTESDPRGDLDVAQHPAHRVGSDDRDERPADRRRHADEGDQSLIRRLIHKSDEIRIADLGSLEGGLSLELAREGWTVTGVEGRESNYRKSELIREYFGLPNLRFRLQDG